MDICFHSVSAQKLDLVETLGMGSTSISRRVSPHSGSSEDELLRNADCVWDGGGNGDPMYYIELCTSYDEAECISSRNGFLDGRCVWLGGKHLNLDEESSDSVEAQVTNKKRKAPQPKQSQRRAPRSSPSKRSHRGPRLSSKERIAAVLNFETVETVDERPFTFDNFDLRMTLALCALIVLMALAAHRLIVRCRCRRRWHSEGDKTRDDDGDYTLLV